jgi:hypothetical protein
LALPSPAPSNTVVINARCSLRIQADQRVIVVAGLPVHHYCAEGEVAEAYATVFLVEIPFDSADICRRVAHVIGHQLSSIANSRGDLDPRDTWLATALAIHELEAVLMVLRRHVVGIDTRALTLG